MALTPDLSSPSQRADLAECLCLSRESLSVEEFADVLMEAGAFADAEVEESRSLDEHALDVAAAGMDAAFWRSGSLAGSPGAYPFRFEADGSRLRAFSQCGDSYCLLLMLSMRGLDGPVDASDQSLSDARALFEDVCAYAAGVYLGVPSDALADSCWAFGWPRRDGPGSFGEALVALHDRLRESYREFAPPTSSPRAKDAKLDVIAWRTFPDRRPGKAILVGQCATGHRNWVDKVKELAEPRKWFEKHLGYSPHADPLRALFVPFALDHDDDEWRGLCFDAGIVFERLRIAYFAHSLPQELSADCQKVVSSLLKRATYP